MGFGEWLDTCRKTTNVHFLNESIFQINIKKEHLVYSTNLTMIDRANRLYHIGLRLIVTKGDFNQALIKLLEAKELVLKMPPSWDRFPRHLSTLFDNIAMLYLSQGDYHKALTSWKQGVNIRCHFQNH